MNTILFTDTLPNVLQKDHMKPVFATKGYDSLDSIGIPTVRLDFLYKQLIKFNYVRF